MKSVVVTGANRGIGLELVKQLLDSANNLNSEEIQILLCQIIPTYKPRRFGPHQDESDSISRRMIKAEA